jgi:hypothetical protein
MKSVVIGGTRLIGSKNRRESIKPGDPRLRIKRRPICRPTKGEGHYQELLRFAGRVATFLRLTVPTRGHIVRLKMEGILFRGILARVIHCYQ